MSILIKFKTASNNNCIIVFKNCFYFFHERYSQKTSKAGYFSYISQILKKIQLFNFFYLNLIYGRLKSSFPFVCNFLYFFPGMCSNKK